MNLAASLLQYIYAGYDDGPSELYVHAAELVAALRDRGEYEDRLAAETVEDFLRRDAFLELEKRA